MYGFRIQSYCLLELISTQTAPMSTSPLGWMTNQSKAAVSDMMIRLIERGYLTKQKAEDRRKLEITITPKGQQFVERTRSWTTEWVSQLFKVLDKTEQKTWLRVAEAALSALPAPQPPKEKPRKSPVRRRRVSEPV